MQTHVTISFRSAQQAPSVLGETSLPTAPAHILKRRTSSGADCTLNSSLSSTVYNSQDPVTMVTDVSSLNSESELLKQAPNPPTQEPSGGIRKTLQKIRNKLKS